MNNKNLRECFGLFSTGVAIASCESEGALYGLTINSFASVSLHPPLLLFSIGNDSYNLKAFRQAKNFIINILSAKQISLAKEFAKSQNDKKWQAENYHFTQNHNLIFENSLGYFECEKFDIIKAGDHHIIIGQIIDFAKLAQEEPLIYFRSEFCKI